MQCFSKNEIRGCNYVIINEYMNTSFKKVMGFNVFSDSLEKIPLNKKSILINTISPNSYGLSKNDNYFSEALKNCDYLVLDGVYFGLSYFFKTGRTLYKNQGPDLTNYFLQIANKKSYKVFFLGSSEETLKKIQQNLNKKFPKILFESFSPVFANNFSIYETQEMINSVNRFEPNILFIGMTCPKQEKWSYENKKLLDANIICNIGAVFDWIAGNQSEIHPIWWKLRLAWLKRTIDRPAILKRYPNIILYFFDMVLDLLRIKKRQ